MRTAKADWPPSEIRQADRSDLAAILELEDQQRMPAGQMTDMTSLEHWLDQPLTLCLVAMDAADQTLCGYILGSRLQEEAEIFQLLVAADRRRQGTGGRLLKRFLECCGSRPCHLEVAADNHAACQLYRCHGFTAVRCRPGYYRRDEQRIDAIAMARIPEALT